MLAMQYSIPLPQNFAPEMIEQRVEERKALFDAHPGMVHKSFLYNQKDHIYAPFYVWKDMNEAQAFLLDDLFHGVTQTFKRPRVRSWVVLALDYGSRAGTPAYALRETDAIPPEENLERFVENEKAEHAALLKKHGNDALYMRLIALDADRWEVLRFSLWQKEESVCKHSADCANAYRVLHISEPGKD